MGVRNVIFVFVLHPLFLSSLLSQEGNIYDFIFKQVIIPRGTCDTHRKLAVVNGEYNKIIEDNYRKEKKRIDRWIEETLKFSPCGLVSWNKQFNECAWVSTKRTERENKFSLKLVLVQLIGEKIQWKIEKWNNCIFLIGGKMARPYFNEQGNACILFYANFAMSTTPGLIDSGVLALAIKDRDKVKTLRCLIEVGHSGKTEEFNLLFNLPQLLEACLQSNKISERQIDNGGDVVRLYNMSGVVIPENYKSFDRHPYFGYMNNSTYDSLPHYFKDAIEKRRTKQNNSKKIV